MNDPNSKDIDINSKVSNTEGGVLAQLWRNILKDANLNSSSKIDFLIKRYLNKEEVVSVGKRKNKNTMWNNATSKKMTWNVFFDLVFNLLRPRKIKFIIEITHANGNVSRSSVSASPDNNSKVKDKYERSDTKSSKK